MSDVTCNNRWVISGELIEKDSLRNTPAGVPVTIGRVHYSGTVEEAEIERHLDFEIGIMAIGELAYQLQAFRLGDRLKMVGFLAPKSKRSRQWILHIQTLMIKDI